MVSFLRIILLVASVTCAVNSVSAQDSVRIFVNPTIDTTPRPSTYKCAIDSLVVGESMYIKWINSGCFHHYKDSIWVARTNSGFSVKHNTNTKKLTTREADVIRDFEYRVFKLSKTFGGCTTSETYIYKRQNKTYTVARDSTCNYDAFTDLLAKLGI